MEEANWEDILEYMYDNDITVDTANEYYDIGDLKDALLEEHPELDPEDISKSVSVMDEYGFLTTIDAPRDRSYLGLSERGFDVAHERKMAKTQTRTSLAIAYLTGGLMITGIRPCLDGETRSVWRLYY
jgi:hypothetical protein